MFFETEYEFVLSAKYQVPSITLTSFRHGVILPLESPRRLGLTKKQQKYKLYHLKNLINMNILQVKKYYL